MEFGEVLTGKIVEVTTVVAGSELATDHLTNATTLFVYDSTDFDEDGGILRIIIDSGDSEADPPIPEESFIHQYLGKDDDYNAIFLTNPLTDDIESETQVKIEPRSTDKWATVYLDDGEDTVPARVDYSIRAGVEEGFRDEDERETAFIQRRGSDYILFDILGKEEYLDGSAIPPGEGPKDPAPDPLDIPVLTAGAGIDSVFLAWNLASIEGAVANVYYEIHASAVDGFEPTQASFYDSTSGITIKVASMPDGSPLSTTAPTYFRVRAYTSGGVGPWSNQVSATAIKGFDQAVIDQLNTDLDSAQGELNTLQNVTIPQLNSELDTAQNDIDNLNNVTLPNLNLELDNAQNDIDNLNNVIIPQINAELDAAQGDLDTLNNVTIPQLNTDLGNARTDIDTLNNVTLPQLNSELSQAQSDIDANELAIGTLNTNLANAQGQINTLNNTTIPNLNSALGVERGRIDTLNNTTIPAINSELDTAQGDLNNLNTITIPGIQSDLTQAQTDLSGLQTDMTGVQSDISAHNTAITNLQTDLDAAELTLSNHTSSISTLNTNLGTAQGQINTLNNTTIPDLNTRLGNAETELDSIDPFNSADWFPVIGTNIADGAISTPKITVNSLNGDRITANTLAAAKIVANSITTAQITAGQVNGDRITANTIAADRIIANSITTSQLTANGISGDRITANTLDASKIVAGSITTDRMTANSISGDRITAGTLDATKIVTGSLVVGGPQTSFAAGYNPRITSAGSGAKTFHNLVLWHESINGGAGNVIIHTPITFNAYMCNLRIRGYNYQPNDTEIDITVGFYAYNTTSWYVNYSQTSSGSCPVSVQLAVDASNRVVLILSKSQDGGLWYYPKISVDEAIIGQSTPPDSFADGWTITRETDLTPYTIKVTPPSRDLDDTNSLTQGWRTTGTTTINGGQITADTILAAALTAGSVTTAKMTANTITGDRIQANTLDAAKIVAGSITSDRITVNTLTGDRIQANTLDAGKIVAGTITTALMTAGTINGDRITTNTLDASKITAGTITTGSMTAGTINGDRITTNSLNADRIVAGTITTGTMTAGTINGDRITVNTLDAGRITAGSITTDRMTVGTILGDRITTNTLDAGKITAGSITTDRMTANTITGDRIQTNTLDAGRIVAGSIASDRMTANTITGDRIQANTLDAAKIVTGSITTNQMTANTINGDRITANTLNASKIVAGSVTSDRMTANTIDGDRIVGNTLDASKITAGTITATQIAGGTITGDKILGGTITGTQLSGTAIDGKTITGATVTGGMVRTASYNTSTGSIEISGDTYKSYYTSNTGDKFKIDTTTSLTRGSNLLRADLDAGGAANKGVWIRMEPGKMDSILVQTLLTLNAEKITLDANGATGSINNQGTLANGGGVYVKGGLDVGGGLQGSGDITFSSLADGGSSNTSTGPKYVRAGANGRLYAHTSAPSSLDLKTKVRPYEGDIEEILAPVPYEYFYKDDLRTPRTGFISQYVHETGPRRFVGYEDPANQDKPIGFHYEDYIAAHQFVLREVWKELKAAKEEMTGLRAELEALKN